MLKTSNGLLQVNNNKKSNNPIKKNGKELE